MSEVQASAETKVRPLSCSATANSTSAKEQFCVKNASDVDFVFAQLKQDQKLGPRASFSPARGPEHLPRLLFPFPAAGCVYIAGGFDGERCLDSVEEYSPTANQWTNLRRMSSARSGVSLVTVHEHVYALGGFDGEHRLQTGEAGKQAPASRGSCH